MSSFLYDLGRACYRRRRLVLGLWLAILVVLGGAVALFSKSFDDDLTIPGAPAQVALDDLSRTFPEVSGASGQVVVVAADGGDIESAEYRKPIEDAITAIEGFDHVDTVTSPYDEMVKGTINDAHTAAIVSVQYDDELTALPETVKSDLEDEVSDLLAQLPHGSAASAGGQLFQVTSVHLSIIEAIGVVVAFIVLFFTLGSLRAAGMPLVTAIIGVAIALMVVVLSTALMTVSSTTPMLALMLGLAVGIDYALFIISRARDLMLEGLSTEEATARATATSGSAVVFAGVTVMVALIGLSVAGIPFLSIMGLAAALAVAVAVAISLTLLPALLGFAGDKVRPKAAPAAGAGDDAEAGSAHAAPSPRRDGRGGETASADAAKPRGLQRIFIGWERLVTKVPALTVIVVIVGLGLFAIPASKLQLALPDGGGAEPGTPQRVAFDLIDREFGPGHNGPLIVMADIVSSDDPLADMESLGDEISQVEGVEVVALAVPNRHADTGIVQVIPTTAPDDPATGALVERLRDMAPQFEREYGFTTQVTGATALAIDISALLGKALLPFGLFVVGFSLVLLMIVFRSLWVPIKATVGYLLSVFTSFGVVVLVFHEGLFAGPLGLDQTGPVISFLPIILMGILFGLAMDYEVFLVTGMREAYVHGADARTAIARGFASTAKVVTAAAVIMFAVFGAFVPAGDAIMKAIALGLAVGVFTDAFIVRMTLVPAVLALLGDRAWYLPRWLDRALPHFDVEGEGVLHQVGLADWPGDGRDYAVVGEDLSIAGADGTRIVDGVDIRLEPGSVLTVAGPGSTALLLALSGRVPFDGGKVKVLGRVLPEQVGRIRAHAPFTTLEASDARLTAGPDDLRRLAQKPPKLLILDHPDRIVDPHTAELASAAVDAALAAGSGVVIGLRDPDADWMIPSGTPFSHLDLRRAADAHSDAAAGSAPAEQTLGGAR